MTESVSIPSRRADPISGAAPAGRLGRTIWKLRQSLRVGLGIRRAFRADGVYFKETSTMPLWRSITPAGGGVKEYRVTYPDGSKQYIRCTSDRIYADPMGPLLLPLFERFASMIRPGARVLCVPGGTGYAASWLGRHVGPSGAVVSLEPDRESVLFAQRRYAAPNVAFEEGDSTELSGEVDGAFDATFSLTHSTVRNDATLLPELWRVTKPGGWMLVGRSRVEAVTLARQIADAIVGRPAEDGAPEVTGTVEVLSASEEFIRLAIARKTEAE